MSDHKHLLVSIAPHGIRKVMFFQDDSLIVEGKLVKCTLSLRIGHNLDQDILNCRVKAFYHYEEEPTELAAIEVENTFTVKNLRSFFRDNQGVVLPFSACVQLASISIGHTRALFTDSLAGSGFQSVLISIMDGMKIAQSWFPISYQESLTPLTLPSSKKTKRLQK